MSGYITYILRCEDCAGAVGVFSDGQKKHIAVTKSYTLMSDTAVIIEKDHEPRLAIDIREKKRWWRMAE